MKLSFHFANLAAQPNLSSEDRERFSAVSKAATSWGMLRISEGVGNAFEKAFV